jgi:hypothetical protein
MEKLNISRVAVLAQLAALKEGIATVVTEVVASNKALITEAVTFEVGKDTYTTFAQAKKIKGKSFNHLVVVGPELDRWSRLLTLSTDETIELEGFEAEALSELLATVVEAKDVELNFSARVSVA